MRALLLFAVLVLVGCGGRAVPEEKSEEKKGGPAPAKGEHFGENWLYGDLLAHFEKQGLAFTKKPGPEGSNYMCFQPPDEHAKQRDLELRATFEALREGRDPPFGSVPSLVRPLTVSKHGTFSDAKKTAVVLNDERHETCFAWGKYVFRGDAELLEKCRKMLPKEGF